MRVQSVIGRVNWDKDTNNPNVFENECGTKVLGISLNIQAAKNTSQKSILRMLLFTEKFQIKI